MIYPSRWGGKLMPVHRAVAACTHDHDSPHRRGAAPSAQRRAVLRALAAGAVLHAGFAPVARAASGTMTLVVAAVPGGGLDHAARLVARRLERDFGRSVIFEYRPGAATRLAGDLVAKSTPDGCALLVTTGASTIDLAFHPDAQPNNLEDFVPVAQLCAGQLLFVVADGSAIRTPQDIVARARAAPGALNFGTVNVQSTQRVVGELFMLSTGTRMVQVPYKAEVAIMVAVANGVLDFGIVGIGTALPMIEAGRVRPIAVASSHRARALPDVPTLAQAGVADVDLPQWYGVLAPAGTPAALVKALSHSIEQAVRSAEYRRGVQAIGLEPVHRTQPEFAALLKHEVARYRDIIDTANLAQ
jgi:tripartite-type tricarboxylate transporter receptor subunit TctC